MTDVERIHHHSTPRSPRGAYVLRRVGIPALAVVTVLSSTVGGLTRSAGGDAIASAKAKAADIEAQLTQAQNEMSALSQQYDEARYHLSQIQSNIATTEANIDSDQQQVAHDKTTLSKAAVANYISDGSAASQNSSGAILLSLRKQSKPNSSILEEMKSVRNWRASGIARLNSLSPS